MYYNSEIKKIHEKKIKDYKHFFISVKCESSLYIPWKVNNHLKRNQVHNQILIWFSVIILEAAILNKQPPTVSRSISYQ